MSTQHSQPLDDLAEELTRRLGIPFVAAAKSIAFRDRLRITDWAVPLMFDGHAKREDDCVIPTGFVGHALWPALKPTRQGRGERSWWYCSLSPSAAEAIVESLRDEDEYAPNEGWMIGHDVLLDEVFPEEPLLAPRRVA